MAEKGRQVGKSNENATERGMRFFRNINALGAVAFAGAAVIAPPAIAAPAAALAGLNAIQAGGFEAWRRHAKKHRVKKDNENQ